jgi:predicted GH43/DUF377 family glycosyl hydrolase
MIDLHHYPQRLTAEAARVVIRPFHIAPDPQNPAQHARASRIVNACMAMSHDQCVASLHRVNHDFDTRHWQTRSVYLRRYELVINEMGLPRTDDDARQQLIGAYFCHEYSYAAAAIMNPSIVLHPDQTGLKAGDQRFVLSLRTVGEGHISSVSFREGIIRGDGELHLWPQPPFSMAAESLEPMPTGAVTARRPESIAISGTVIFPFTPQQRNGLEDLRLVRFTEDDGEATYYGTYTAYSGYGIQSELMATQDFRTFHLLPMQGEAVRNKGMALFPRRIDGGYAVIGRQDGESLYYLQSHDLRRWERGEFLLKPHYPWELVQIGNCGAPIELDEGWLLLTHGVGAMRQYAIGAVLLDKTNPQKVIGRMAEPLLSPSTETREGYVPNVVYTCGTLKHGEKLFLPYGVADSSVAFAMVDLKSLLSAMV